MGAGVLAVLLPAGSGRSARATTATAVPLTRYSLVHGCFDLESRPDGRPIAPAAGPFRMQAATLGVYLLYGGHRTVPTAGPSGTTPPAAGPTVAAEGKV